MGRIARSIKTDFPQSESVGRLSRDGRLCFIQLWLVADDDGRLRGNSRMLASLLYPYDDDARDLIDGWLGEIEREQCIVRYQAEGESYIQICKWLQHQKIDKPSKSKFPAPQDVVARTREDSRKLVPEGNGEERMGGESRGGVASEVEGETKPGESSAEAVEPPAESGGEVFVEFNPTEAAMYVGNELNISGHKAREDIREAIKLRCEKTAFTPREVAESLVETYRQFAGTELEPVHREFTVGKVKFITDGWWLERHRWPKVLGRAGPLSEKNSARMAEAMRVIDEAD